MRAATAIAERYRDLGFRVIEGGKSNKLIVVNSLAFAESNGLRHDNLLRDIRADLKEMPSDLRTTLHIDFRESFYRDRYNKPQPCFELTKAGFMAIALRYDAALRYRYARAFTELEEQYGQLAPVTHRLQQLQPQGELFELAPSVVLKQPRHMRLVENPDDPCDAPLFGSFEYKPTPDVPVPPTTRREFWVEHYAGDYEITVRYKADKPWYIRSMADTRKHHDRKCIFLPSVPQCILTFDKPNTPRVVIDAVVKRLHLNTQIVMDTLDAAFR